MNSLTDGLRYLVYRLKNTEKGRQVTLERHDNDGEFLDFCQEILTDAHLLGFDCNGIEDTDDDDYFKECCYNAAFQMWS